MNTQKTKKEHYVPRCYLKRWQNKNGKVYVLDKINNKRWISNIEDIACERYFYDIPAHKINANFKKYLKENGVTLEVDEQFIEHIFSEQVENNYSKLLGKIIDKDITPWYEQACYFISREDKYEMSFFLVYQLIRTKTMRQIIRSSSDVIEKFLRETNVNEEIIQKHILGKDGEKETQTNMLFDIDNICQLMFLFNRLSWILVINKTDKPFFTSNHPIVLYPYIKNSLLPFSGIGSPGIEVSFPLSPKYLLVMRDPHYHKLYRPLDREFLAVYDERLIDEYNKRCLNNFCQFVYSKENSFNV